jgi:hypothetical protein
MMLHELVHLHGLSFLPIYLHTVFVTARFLAASFLAVLLLKNADITQSRHLMRLYSVLFSFSHGIERTPSKQHESFQV